MASNRQKAASSHTGHGDHGEAEACSEPPPADEPPLTSGVSETPLYGPIFFYTTLAQPLILLCFVLTAGAAGSHNHKRAAADVALRRPQNVAKGIGRFDSYVNYSPARHLQARLALQNLEEDKSVVQSKPDPAPL